MQQHLFRNGLATPRVIEASGGDGCVACDGGFWALFTFVSGTEYDFQREAQVREAARWLAHFHITSEGFGERGPTAETIRGATGETIPDVRRWWLDGEAELAGLGSMFRDHGVEAELNYLRRWHSGLLRTWPLALDTLPPGWVHGDYHGSNLLFAGDHLAGLLDVDVVHRGFRIEDVALALFTFGRQRCQSLRIRPYTARALLDEYAPCWSDQAGAPRAADDGVASTSAYRRTLCGSAP